MLYMPAVVAVQHNPDLKRKYEALLANGKPRKVALTAVMRKHLVLANALVQRTDGGSEHILALNCASPIQRPGGSTSVETPPSLSASPKRS